MPPALVQRNASRLEGVVPRLPEPTTTEPSALTPLAELSKSPPERSPSPTMPLPLVQRKASCPAPSPLKPTTVEPSSLTALATLRNPPPGKSPRGARLAAAKARAADVHSSIARKTQTFERMI